jgi:hypothetical protein
MRSLLCCSLFIAGLPSLAIAQGTAAAPKPAVQAPPPAAGPQQPSMTMVLKSVDELYNDLRYILMLSTGPKVPNAWTKLKDVLDLYVEGVDKTQPIVIEYKVRNSKFKQVLQVPIQNLRAFLSNIKQLGVKTKPVPGAGVPDFYQVSGLTSGYLRVLGGKVAIFAEDRADLLGSPAAPAALVATLAKQYDTGAAIENTPQGMPERKQAMQDIVKEVLASLKPSKDETPEEFQLRKATVEHQMAEIERFYVEAAQILMGWTTNAPQHVGVLNITLSTIPGTSLEKSLQLVGSAPSYFAGYQIDQNAPLSGVVNFALDELRQRNFQASLKLSRPVALQQIAKNTKLDAQQKTHAQQVSDLIHDVLEHAATNGLLDGFVDARPAANNLYAAVGGLRVDGAIVLRGLQGIKDGVQMGVDREGDVEIHSVALPANRPGLEELFGKNAAILVGTSPQAVWYAVGPDAMPRLKEAIQKLTQPPTAKVPSPALAFHVKFGPWVTVAERHRGPKKLKKGDIDIGKLALDAFKHGADTMSFRLERVENRAEVHMQINEGVFRFVGAVMAQFIDQTLE